MRSSICLLLLEHNLKLYSSKIKIKNYFKLTLVTKIVYNYNLDVDSNSYDYQN